MLPSKDLPFKKHVFHAYITIFTGIAKNKQMVFLRISMCLLPVVKTSLV